MNYNDIALDEVGVGIYLIPTFAKEDLPLNNTPNSSSGQYMLRSRTRSTDNITNCAFIADVDEPQNYQKAVKEEAMGEEFYSLVNNKTWSLVQLPEGKTAISNKWVYKVKRNQDGEVERYKARLVDRGFTQKYGVDYEETFRHVAKFTSIQIYF